MNDRNDNLIKRAASLPREIAPDRDLWPGIARRLEPVAARAPVSRRRLWPAALAAGLSLAVLSSALTWWIANRETVSAEQLAEILTQSADPYAQNSELVEVRRQLTASLDTALNSLAPKTRRQVTSNLIEIHESMTEIRAALEQDPNNNFLHQLLQSTYLQEMELMANINRLAISPSDEIEI